MHNFTAVRSRFLIHHHCLSCISTPTNNLFMKNLTPPQSMTQQVTMMAQVVATALQQAGITNTNSHSPGRIGPRPINSKDLLPSGFKQWNGNYLEFGPWWTRLKNALGSASPEWRAVLQRLHEFGKLRVENDDLDLIVGSRDLDVQKA